MSLGSRSFSPNLAVWTTLALVAVSMFAIAGCTEGGRETSGLESTPPAPTPAAPALSATPLRQVDSAAAITLFKSKGCIACHVVSGIPEAVGTIGPPLDGLASRRELAAGLPVTADNIARWIRDPADVKPGTVMPPLVHDEDEIDILVAWLLTLR